MPVLPNPDPQVWRMLLGDRADEILGMDGEKKEIPAPPEKASPAADSRNGPDEGGEGLRKDTEPECR